MNISELEKLKQLCIKLGIDFASIHCELLSETSFEKTKAILGLDYWKEDRFKDLLTSTIWNATL